MRGIRDFNFPAFHAAEAYLKKAGHSVFNPARRDEDIHGVGALKSPTGSLKTIEKKGFSLRDALGADTAWICASADAIALLPGWRRSKGAKAEKALAEALGLEVYFIKKADLC